MVPNPVLRNSRANMQSYAENPSVAVLHDDKTLNASGFLYQGSVGYLFQGFVRQNEGGIRRNVQ